MLKDDYIINSGIYPNRKGVNQNIRTFLEFFNAFYDKIRQKKYPSFFHEMCDPYGFALLCKDYYNPNLKYDMNYTCKEIFEGKGEEDHLDVISYHGQFSFVEILNFLYRGFWFDYDKALAVYDNQHDAFNVFNQIINGQGYIFNRARPELKKSKVYFKNAIESIIELDEDEPIQIPHIWRVCDGMIPPFIVTQHYRDVSVEVGECHGYGEGIFVIANGKIIDVLKINDTWFTDLPLENRLKYAYKCTEFEVAPFVKAWSLRSIFNAGKLLGANSTNGLLVRCARENFFTNKWFNWSKTSLVYCYNSSNGLVAAQSGPGKPTWYTLEGDEGVISPFEERVREQVWLDDFDIKEFQRVLRL